MDMLENDHYVGLQCDGRGGGGPIFLHASQLYFAYHPPPYHFRIFTEFEPAEAWVKEELERCSG